MPDTQSTKTQTYVVQTTTWIGPHLKQPADEVEMTEAQAQYYVPHILKPKAEPEPEPGSDTKSTTKSAAKSTGGAR